MKAAIVILFVSTSPNLVIASNWCIHNEYKRNRFPDCQEFTNVVDRDNCIVATIAERCKRTPADVFNLLQKQLLEE